MISCRLDVKPEDFFGVSTQIRAKPMGVARVYSAVS